MVLIVFATTDDLTADSALCVLVSGSPKPMYDPFCEAQLRGKFVRIVII